MNEGWGHYGDLALEASFVLCMVAWNLLCLDLVQALKKWKQKREERKQWR